MLKNKEDNFLGDNITSNIKYADNEWQAHGTVDRHAVYTKESILHLIFEENEYLVDKGVYKSYVPRGSTKALKSKNYVAAKLQHDLSLIDTIYYSTTPIECSINIFDMDTFLKKGIGIANPVFDSKTDYDILQIVDPDKISSKVTLDQFFSVLDETNYIRSDKVQKGSYTKSLYSRYAYKSKGTTVTPSGSDSLKSLLANDGFKEVFQRDFQLHLHDPENIKLPFHKRGTSEAEGISEDTRTYRTRFVANSFSGSLVGFDILQQTRVEFLNDLIEEAVLSTKFKNELSLSDNEISNSVVTADSLFKSLSSDGYKKLLETVNGSGTSPIWKNQIGIGVAKTNLADLLKNVQIQDSCISYLLPQVYAGYNDDVDFTSSYGIHFLSQEDTTNLFQDKDESYKIFNEVVLGYNMVNGLLSARTFLGTVKILLTKSDSSITPDIPLWIATKFDYVSNKGLDYYVTVSMLNNAYKLGHGEEFANLSMPEIESTHLYELADELKGWLEQECFVFKTPVYGDYVEELNFMQDLNPDSDVQFNNLRLKKTELTYTRLQDSKYEVPYVEQTSPLLNGVAENKKGQGVYASKALAGVGNKTGYDGEPFVFPPYIYDYDKGSEEDKLSDNIDLRNRSNKKEKQRINSRAGGLVVEDRIISPTIDELWSFLKYLTESDGKAKRDLNAGINERLPSFFGTKKDSLLGSLFSTQDGVDNITNTVNPMASGDKNQKEVDILNWEVSQDKDTFKALHYNTSSHPEIQFGGFKVTRYIEKIYDYKVNIFGRRLVDTFGATPESWDGSKYEFNTEDLNDYNNSTGYLEKLFNNAILGFAVNHITTGKEGLLSNVLDEVDFGVDELDNDKKSRDLFKIANDLKFIANNFPIESSKERKEAFEAISRILTWHKATDGKNDLIDNKETSYHNHFKKYLDQPKNLKEIERDLETIRQNLQAVVEYFVVSSTNKGFNDRSFNRGTLHELHRNHYRYDSTLLRARLEKDLDEDGTILDDALNQTWPQLKGGIVELRKLSDSLNNLLDTLDVPDLDRKVVFEDGQFDERYQRAKYDRSVIDLRDTKINERNKHEMYRANETLLSETYLAGDGTWRSVHEHTVLPVVYDDM